MGDNLCYNEDHDMDKTELYNLCLEAPQAISSTCLIKRGILVYKKFNVKGKISGERNFQEAIVKNVHELSIQFCTPLS